jgi:DNA-binding transcriptional MerR regulator
MLEQVSSLRKQCEQLGRSLEDSNNKLQSKEEMTTAAIAARNAAERSLRIADERAVQLRERVEELNRQFDALERLGDGGITSRLHNICWPYEWFRGRPAFFQGNNSVTQPSAEMGELFEPLVDSNS